MAYGPSGYQRPPPPPPPPPPTYYQPYSYYPQGPYYPPSYGPPQKSSALGGKGGLITAIMLIIGAIIDFILGGLLTVLGLVVSSVAYVGSIGGLYAACGIFWLIAAIIAIIAAVFSFKNQKWGLVLIGSILLVLGYSFIFGILALIFVIISKDEFDS